MRGEEVSSGKGCVMRPARPSLPPSHSSRVTGCKHGLRSPAYGNFGEGWSVARPYRSVCDGGSGCWCGRQMFRVVSGRELREDGTREWFG